MTKDEICDYARDCAQAFLRERKIDEQEHDDYLQEAVVIALARSGGKKVNKHFISESVKKELLKMWRRETNEGFGSHNVSSPDHVSLSETVNGAYDEDGEPLTYGDTLVYEEPPQGFGDPLDELESSVDMDRMLRAVKALPDEDREFVEVALLSGLTQAAAAKRLGTTQSAVSRRVEGVVKRLRTILA